MKRVNFSFINDNGQKKKGYVWIDLETYNMIWKLDEPVRVSYLREIYYEQIKSWISIIGFSCNDWHCKRWWSRLH